MSTRAEKAKVAIIIFICFIITVTIPTGIYCIVKQQSPVAVVQTMFSSNADRIVGKWQDDSRTSAYEFKKDGTYTYYLSTMSYSGQYSVKGNELAISDPSNEYDTIYEIKLSDKQLKMTCVEQGGAEKDKSKEPSAKYNKVTRIENKTITEILSSAIEDAEK